MLLSVSGKIENFVDNLGQGSIFSLKDCRLRRAEWTNCRDHEVFDS